MIAKNSVKFVSFYIAFCFACNAFAQRPPAPVPNPGNTKVFFDLLDEVVSPRPFATSPAMDKNGNIFIATDRSELQAYRLDSLKKLKKLGSIKFADSVITAPVIDRNGTMYLSTRNRKFYALIFDSKNSFTILDSIQFPGEILRSPSISPDGVVYAPTTSGFLHALVLNSKGKFEKIDSYKFFHQYGGGSNISTPNFNDKNEIFVSFKGKIHVLKLDSNGKFQYVVNPTSNKSSGFNGTPMLGKGNIIYGHLSLHSYSGGNSIDQISHIDPVYRMPIREPVVSNDGIVFSAASAFEIHALKIEKNGTLKLLDRFWTNQAGQYLAPMLGKNGLIYFLTEEKVFIFEFTKSNKFNLLKMLSFKGDHIRHPVMDAEGRLIVSTYWHSNWPSPRQSEGRLSVYQTDSGGDGAIDSIQKLKEKNMRSNGSKTHLDFVLRRLLSSWSEISHRLEQELGISSVPKNLWACLKSDFGFSKLNGTSKEVEINNVYCSMETCEKSLDQLFIPSWYQSQISDQARENRIELKSVLSQIKLRRQIKTCP